MTVHKLSILSICNLKFYKKNHFTFGYYLLVRGLTSRYFNVSSRPAALYFHFFFFFTF